MSHSTTRRRSYSPRSHEVATRPVRAIESDAVLPGSGGDASARRPGLFPPSQVAASFPGAPPGAVISEEGWLLIDDEAWTAEDWASFVSQRPGRRIRHGYRYQTDEERQEARRTTKREWNRKHRGQAA